MAKKTRKKDTKPANPRNEMLNSLLEIFNNNPTQAYNFKQICKRLDINDGVAKQAITKILDDLVLRQDLTELTVGKYRLNSQTKYLTGKLQMTSSQNAFVISPDSEEDVFIAQKNLNHALGGDTVKVYLYARRDGRKLEGEVVEVLERKHKQFVGIVEVAKHFAFLVPDSKEIPYDIFIPLDKLLKAKNGQKAVAKITEWPKNAKNPLGEITEVLGQPGANETEMHAILAEFELPLKFSEAVLKEAETIDATITQTEIKQRRDFRNITTFTIDPIDAKDFDDALSYQVLANGNTEVGVHIADVTHYIKPGTVLDDEGLERATSVYLVDRVVPMLPERLSNNICSLRPNEDKLCYSAVFELDAKAQIVSEWFGRTIINSNRRLHYEEAQQIIDTGDGDLANVILAINGLARQLRERRLKAGAIAFEREEVKFIVDEKGKPLSVYFKENKESNQLIEEFMLLANRRVAEFVGKQKEKSKPKTFVYRIHDKPNTEKLLSFANFIKKFGRKIDTEGGKKTATSLNKLIHDVKGTSEENIVSNLALRSMAKAEYSTKNVGHYGLAFEYYTHFTSPIRRYPDMMVHRLLDHYLKNGESKKQDKYEKLCKHASEMEKRATDAERASIKYKQVEFMTDKIGQIYDGTISGITEWGIYVEIIENKCEGMVPIRELADDFYHFDEDNYCLIGKRNGKRFQLGDVVKIKVWRTNLLKKQMDFRIAGTF